MHVNTAMAIALHLMMLSGCSCHVKWYDIKPFTMSLKPVMKDLQQAPDVMHCVIFCNEDPSCQHAEYNTITGDCLALKGYAEVEGAILSNPNTTVVATAAAHSQISGKYTSNNIHP